MMHDKMVEIKKNSTEQKEFYDIKNPHVFR